MYYSQDQQCIISFRDNDDKTLEWSTRHNNGIIKREYDIYLKFGSKGRYVIISLDWPIPSGFQYLYVWNFGESKWEVLGYKENNIYKSLNSKKYKLGYNLFDILEQYDNKYNLLK